MENRQGNTLKGYKLEERIGSGGFGAVYRAKQTTIEREVAVKIILPGYANNPDFIRRFESEAHLIARLEHPHITPLIDFWRDPDGAYLVMRYLRGGSVRQSLDNENFELLAISQLLDQLASALDFAHRNHVIHRDIKPGNILLDEDGNAYLADFGIAKDLTISDSHTSPEAVVGSLDYISPEQARSEPVTPKTDIYSLGVTLYEMITGQHPFKEASSVERLYKHINDPLPEIENLPENLRDTINIIIQKATAKNPEERYPDVMALALAFREGIGRGTSRDLSIVEQLTMREQEILALISDGLSNAEIANELFITVSTVKWHITQLYKKLGVRSRVQAIVRGRELNLIVTGDTDDHLVKQVGDVSNISLPEPENPYKGLHAFQTSDVHDFYGRDDLIQKLIDRMCADDLHHRFLAIVGPSGSGKSSLVKAGLIPALWKGNIQGSEKWFVVDMMPGSHPIDKLEAALIRVAANQAGNLAEQLQRDERGLLRVADIILPQDDTELVIVVDQFEEVFTLIDDEAQRQHFLNLLRVAVSDKRSRIRVIVTLRADYYDRPLHYPEFGQILRTQMETVLPLSAKGLERAIAAPAERQGVTFEQGLVSQIVSEMNYQAGALPLLQYALTELFDRREGRILTHAAYNDIGGAVGALANRADEIFLSMPETAQKLTQQLFLRLVTLGEGAEDTRRRTPFSELLSISDDTDLIEEIIDSFVDYRLLSLDHDEQTRQPTVEVAHEAILREWERLRAWLNESRDDIRQERILSNAAQDWDAHNRDASYLLRGSRLEQFETWTQSSQLILTPLEKYFVETSLLQRAAEEQAERDQIEREKEQALREKAQEKRSQNLLRLLVAVFALATVLSGGFGIFAFNQRNLAIEAQESIAAEQENTLVALDIAQSSALAFAANTAIDRGEMDLAIALAVESAQTDELLPETLRVLERISEMGGPAVWVENSETLCAGATSPDGRYRQSFDCIERVDLWDTLTGEKIQTFSAPDLVIRYSEMSPDNQRIVTHDGNGTWTAWDVATGEILNSFPTETNILQYFFAWDASHMWISTADYSLYEAEGHIVGEKIILYDVLTGEVTQEYEFEDIHFNQVNFSADGTLGIIGGWDNYELRNYYRVHTFDVETGEILQSFDRDYTSIPDNGRFGPRRVGFSPDNSQIWLGGFPNYIIDLATGEDVLTIAYERITWIDNDFERVAVQDQETGDWFAIDLQTGEEESLPTFGNAYIGPDSNSIVGSMHGTPRFWTRWDLNGRGINNFVLPIEGHWGGNAFNPQGNFIVSAMGSVNTNNPFLEIRNSTTGELSLRIEEDEMESLDIDWSADGRYIAVGNHAGEVIIFDAQTGEEVQRLTDIDQLQIQTVRFTADSQSVVAGFGSPWNQLFYEVPPYILVWDIETGEVTKRIEFSAGGELQNWGVGVVRIAPNSQLAYVSIWDTYNSIDSYIVDLITGEIIHEFPQEWGGWADFTPNGEELVIGTILGEILVVDVNSGEILRQWQSSDSDIGFIAISPDGRYMATGSGPSAFESAISLWDLETGDLLRRYIGHDPQSFILDIDFSPDGTQIASAANDGTVRIWEVDPQSSLDWVLENRAVRDFTCAERTLYRIEPLCESEE